MKGKIVSLETEKPVSHKSTIAYGEDIASDILEHWGVQGMKWGVRKSRSKTGLSRTAGAKLDKNARNRAAFKKSIKGHARSGRIGALKNYQQFQSITTRRSILQKRIKHIDAQDKRIRAGKQTAHDKLQMFGSLAISDLYISRRPS